MFNWDAAIMPAFSLHPLTLAGAALTAQAAAGGRLTLGVGTSHEFIVEGVYGMSYPRPLDYLRDYLTVLLPAMEGKDVDFRGDQLTARIWLPLDMPGVEQPEVVLAALGPR